MDTRRLAGTTPKELAMELLHIEQHGHTSMVKFQRESPSTTNPRATTVACMSDTFVISSISKTPGAPMDEIGH